MKVVFLTGCNSRSAGGLFFTITEYTKALKKLGVDISVVGFDNEYSKSDLPAYGDVPVIIYNRSKLPVLSTFGYSKDLNKILENIKPSIIHLQGLWMYHSYAALKYKRKHPDTKIIIEPHGMLDEWALTNSKWKKKIVGYLFEYENIRKADCIHALCSSEKDSIIKLGLNDKVQIIPNGIVMPHTNNHKSKHSKKTLLYIGRIHPKKGLEYLIDAIALSKKTNSTFLNNWNVIIAGWDQNGYQHLLESKTREYELDNNIKFIGAVFNEEKNYQLLNADAFILPSLSEGLPMSILEAWSFNLPVIMTSFCNLPEGFSHNAAIKVDPNATSILSGLNNLNEFSSEELSKIGSNGVKLVLEKFTWNKIALETLNLYNEVNE